MVYSTEEVTLQELWQEIGLMQPSQQQLWLLFVSQLLTAVNCATKLMVVLLNIYTRFTNSLSANADVFNGLVY
jgi:hypothetical protein